MVEEVTRCSDYEAYGLGIKKARINEVSLPIGLPNHRYKSTVVVL